MAVNLKAFSPEFRTLIEAFLQQRNAFVVAGKNSGELRLEVNIASAFTLDAQPRLSIEATCYHYAQKNTHITAKGHEVRETMQEVMRQLQRDQQLLLLEAPSSDVADTNSNDSDIPF